MLMIEVLHANSVFATHCKWQKVAYFFKEIKEHFDMNAVVLLDAVDL